MGAWFYWVSAWWENTHREGASALSVQTDPEEQDGVEGRQMDRVWLYQWISEWACEIDIVKENRIISFFNISHRCAFLLFLPKAFWSVMTTLDM